MNDDIDHYSDIIDLPHHKSVNHPHMPQADRAAQFAPFAALVGFEDILRKVAKQHEQRMDGGSH